MQSQDRVHKKTNRIADMLHSYLFIFRPKDEQSSPITRKHLPEQIRGALLGLVAFLFARSPLLFSVNPLGLCLLAASNGAMGWISLGLAIGLWQYSPHPWLYGASAALIWLFRLLVQLFLIPSHPDGYSPQELRAQYLRQRRNQLWRLLRQGGTTVGDAQEQDEAADTPPLLSDEPIHRRVTIATLCALIPCLGVPLQGDFAFYDLYGSLFYLLATPLITYLLAHALSADVDEHGQPSARQTLGIATLFLAIAYCARDVVFLGLSPVLLLTTLGLLLAVRRYGLGAGAMVGALGALTYDVRTVPLLLAIALLYALLHPILNGFSLLPALLVTLLYTLLGGGDGMFWAVVPSVAVGMLCFSVVARVQQLTQDTSEHHTSKQYRQNKTEQQLVCEQNRNAAMCHRLSSVAGSFGSLSEVFHQLSETLSHPSAHEIRHLCDEVYDDYCPKCDKREICWSSDYATTGSGIYALSRAIASGKGASAEHLPDALRSRCPHTASILGDIGYRASRRTMERANGTDTEAFAQSYDTIACLLRDILREDAAAGQDFVCSEERSEAVARYLGEHGIHPRQVCVCGERRKTIQIFGLSPAALTVSQDELRQAISQICEAEVSRVRYDGSDDGTLTLHTLPLLRADYVHRSVAAIEKPPAKQSKRTVCGDSLRLFESDGGIFHALLCDGMGSGRNAALTSASCGVFLERVLRTDVSVQTALRMLNHYLRSRSASPEDECSSTVDLFSLDLYTGQARFVKSGAAPSMIIRDGRLYRLASHTIPIGILQAIDTQVIPFEVRAGDHILLLSDGITDAGAPFDQAQDSTPSSRIQTANDWLTDFLSGDLPEEDHALIDRLIELARLHGSDDDISVISIRIRENQ